MSVKHKVKAKVFNIDENKYEELEFEVSDDIYRIITNGIGEIYSIDSEQTKHQADVWHHECRSDSRTPLVHNFGPSVTRCNVCGKERPVVCKIQGCYGQLPECKFR